MISRKVVGMEQKYFSWERNEWRMDLDLLVCTSLVVVRCPD